MVCDDLEQFHCSFHFGLLALAQNVAKPMFYANEDESKKRALVEYNGRSFENPISFRNNKTCPTDQRLVRSPAKLKVIQLSTYTFRFEPLSKGGLSFSK